MPYVRQRSACAAEEANVSDFVESCVNFSTNVVFHPMHSAAALGRGGGASGVHTVLLLGNEVQLKRLTSGECGMPYDGAALQDALELANDGEVYVACTENQVRLLIGKVPTTASRHNCPARPDVMHNLIKEAIRQCPRKDRGAGLDVYYTNPGYELCLAAVVARASNRSFSAKEGKAEESYLQPGRPVRVFLDACSDHSLHALHTLARCVQLCQRLVDAPTNLLDTVTFTEIASRWVEKLKEHAAVAGTGARIDMDVIQGEELREKGYGGLYGTGKAAEYPPHLVTLSYCPGGGGIAPQDKIAFVGKGIVYDTGGLAIKSRDGMRTMKHDMGGAAAIFCGFLCLVQLGAPLELSSILCLADNAVGPRAQRNDDILRLRSGITIEINNTDAEGRLVLSDGVYHASAELPFRPAMIVDMATLTGAQAMCTGKLHAAIYANTEAAETRFVEAGRQCGDMCFPVLYCPELHNLEYKSEVADYCNSVANRVNAQVSCAGQFIGNNLAKDYAGEWVHVDLAGPATYDEGTGFGVTLLAEVFGRDLFA